MSDREWTEAEQQYRIPAKDTFPFGALWAMPAEEGFLPEKAHPGFVIYVNRADRNTGEPLGGDQHFLLDIAGATKLRDIIDAWLAASAPAREGT